MNTIFKFSAVQQAIINFAGIMASNKVENSIIRDQQDKWLEEARKLAVEQKLHDKLKAYPVGHVLANTEHYDIVVGMLASDGKAQLVLHYEIRTTSATKEEVEQAKAKANNEMNTKVLVFNHVLDVVEKLLQIEMTQEEVKLCVDTGQWVMRSFVEGEVEYQAKEHIRKLAELAVTKRNQLLMVLKNIEPIIKALGGEKLEEIFKSDIEAQAEEFIKKLNEEIKDFSQLISKENRQKMANVGLRTIKLYAKWFEKTDLVRAMAEDYIYSRNMPAQQETAQDYCIRDELEDQLKDSAA